MAIFAAYFGDPETEFTLIHNKQRLRFPYKVPVEVDADAAKYLKTLMKPNTEDPVFRFSGTKEKPLES